MSRIGRREIKIPTGVEVHYADGYATVKGPKGTLKSTKLKEVIVEIVDGIIKTTPVNKYEKFSYSMSGTANSLINGMIIGVTEGYKKELEINGVGYRAQLVGRVIKLSLGLSHPVEMELPEGLEAQVPKPTKIIITGADKQKVGQFASQIRAKREPEPYKGKGIKYSDEQIIRKEGKKAGK